MRGISEEPTLPTRPPLYARRAVTVDEGWEDLPPPPLVRGTIIGDRYTLVAPLARGGMGDVFRVRHRTLAKEFALKMLSASFAEDARARAMFDREARLASSMSHPNIVSIVDFGEDLTHGAYMVMELIDGVPLLDRIDARPLPLRLACELTSQVADALRYIHEHEVIHGDIKAENILLATEPTADRRRTRIVLLDFGLARRRHGSRRSTDVDGTPDYMAPERILGGDPSVATDVYSLGVLAYLVLTGRKPFTGSLEEVLHAHVHTTPQRLSVARGEELDERIEALVARALAKDPADRHPDASRFLYELRTVMDMLGMTQRHRARRGPEVDPRVAAAAVAFEHSPVPLASVSVDGLVMAANAAFAHLVAAGARDRLVGTFLWRTRLASVCPELLEDIPEVAATGKPRSRVLPDDATGALGKWRVAYLMPSAEPDGPVHVTITPPLGGVT